ncbi:MAG: hypothetical protein AMK73_07890 [Planctomycetes bacterium SM23_32]|nr:MAG: hypothetical protein AMK73_07890 [Planctomycetes bacterium SM23_32]
MRIFTARSFWLPVLLATLAAALFGAVLARRGRQLERALEEQARLEAGLQELEELNARSRAERDALLSSPEAIERVAREDYGFAAPGEQVSEFASGAGAAIRPRRRPPHDVSPWQKVLMWRQLPLAVPAAAFVLTALICASANASARSDEEAA